MSDHYNRNNTFNYRDIYIILILSLAISCKRLINIPEPADTITTSETFSTEADATSAIIGIYNNMINAVNPCISNGGTTLYTGLSADEMNLYLDDAAALDFQNNSLKPDNVDINFMWTTTYSSIYQCNAAIEGLQASMNISSQIKNQLLGEAKFIRAFCHFYLTNLFGDVPLVTTTSWSNNSLKSRNAQSEVYQQIKTDLNDAKGLLKEDYISKSGERVRVNKFTADALLSRVYLYTRQWDSARIEASTVINNTMYSLPIDLNLTFLINSPEAIWELQINEDIFPYSTLEGFSILPPQRTSNPRYYITNSLLDAFEPGDKRRQNWIDSTIYSGSTYYYPSKYKTRVGTQDNVTENYVVLRLAELYLIRSEAYAQDNMLPEAITDIDTLRSRAGLPTLSPGLTQQEVLSAIRQERRVELFSEWGHRWLDLKRTGKADSTLSPIKGSSWQSSDQLYPIPFSEIQTDPKLIQNPGYN